MVENLCVTVSEVTVVSAELSPKLQVKYEAFCEHEALKVTIWFGAIVVGEKVKHPSVGLEQAWKIVATVRARKIFFIV